MTIIKKTGLALFLLFIFAARIQAATIDLMIVYDTTGKKWADTNAGSSTIFAQDAVARMNKAMEDSGIDLNFHLVHTAVLDYTHTDLDSDMSKLSSSTTVSSWRNTFGADLVAMLVDTGSASGWIGYGNLLTSRTGNSNAAFTVSAVQAVEIGHTMTHEIGHNLGAHHSKDQTEDPGPNYYLNSYSAGWYFKGSDAIRYHTIMAYNYDDYGTIYTEAPVFSSPLVKIAGTAAGDAADGDNARTIRETMNLVASYRSSASTTFTVTAAAGTGGSVTPVSRIVNRGSYADFTVRPDSGYIRNTAVTGTCPQGTWNGEIYTTGPVTSDCTVNFSFAPTLQDDHGNSCSESTFTMNADSDRSFSADGNIETTGDTDYFKIMISSPGTIEIYTTGETDTFGSLRDYICSVIRENDDTSASNYNFSINQAVTVGTYYMAVSSSGADTGPYRLNIRFTGTQPEKYSVSVTRLGTGEGRITSSPAAIDCSDFCSYLLEKNMQFMLYAVPASGSEFRGWSGAYTGSSNPLLLTVDSEKNINAVFDKKTVVTSINERLGKGIQNINIQGTADAKTGYTDYGGMDIYTVLPYMTGDVEINDNDQTLINLPPGLNITGAVFAGNSVQFAIGASGNKLTIIADDLGLYIFVFAGTPLEPLAGIRRTYQETAAAFGTTVPSQGINYAAITGTIQSDGSIK